MTTAMLSTNVKMIIKPIINKREEQNKQLIGVNYLIAVTFVVSLSRQFGTYYTTCYVLLLLWLMLLPSVSRLVKPLADAYVTRLLAATLRLAAVHYINFLLND